MPQSVLQPVIICIGEQAAGNPTQFLLSAALQQMGLDWQCITAQVDNEELAAAVDGVAAMKMSGVVFLDTLSFSAEREVCKLVGGKKISGNRLSNHPDPERQNSDTDLGPETNPSTGGKEQPQDCLQRPDPAQPGLLRISAMRYSDGEFELFDCLPTAVWNTLAEQREPQTQIVVISDARTFDYFVSSERRWLDAKCLVVHEDDQENESPAHPNSISVDALHDGLLSESNDLQFVYLNPFGDSATSLDQLKTVHSELSKSKEAHNTEFFCITEVSDLDNFQTVDPAEIVLQSRIANLCFVAQIQNPKSHGLNVLALRDALEEFQQW